MKKSYEKEKSILEVISSIFVAIMIILFPLVVNSTGFFHILECKWYFYLYTSITYLMASLVVLLYFLIFKKVRFFKDCKLSTVQWFAIAFFLVNYVSCFLSPFYQKYNLFVGVGRGEGLIMMGLYSLTFLSLTLFYKFDKKVLLYFSISSILVSFIAILQYLGFNPLNLYQDGIGTHNVSFMATIGNKDFLSAYYTLMLPISFVSYILYSNKKAINLLSIIMGVFIFEIINVDSGKVAFILTLGLFLPFLVSNNKKISSFLQMIAAVLFGYLLNVIVAPKYLYAIHDIKVYFHFNLMVLFYLIIIGLLVYLSMLFKNKFTYDKLDKKIIKYYYLLIIAFLFLGLIIIYFINVNSGIIYEVYELLHGNFNDKFGSYRIFLWKRTLSLVKDYPLIGSGPDTFAIRFMRKYTSDVASIGTLTINDTAANVYLTMLINIGIIGLLIYLGFITSQIIKGIKKNNVYSIILLSSIICYLIQDFFNISVVIVTPIFWVLMAVHHQSLEDISLTKK